MVDREHLFLILIESLFPDRYSEICAVTSDNLVSGEIESEKNDWEEIVIELKVEIHKLPLELSHSNPVFTL